MKETDDRMIEEGDALPKNPNNKNDLAMNDNKCYKCNKHGHFARKCRSDGYQAQCSGFRGNFGGGLGGGGFHGGSSFGGGRGDGDS